MKGCNWPSQQRSPQDQNTNQTRRNKLLKKRQSPSVFDAQVYQPVEDEDYILMMQLHTEKKQKIQERPDIDTQQLNQDSLILLFGMTSDYTKYI